MSSELTTRIRAAIDGMALGRNQNVYDHIAMLWSALALLSERVDEQEKKPRGENGDKGEGEDAGKVQ